MAAVIDETQVQRIARLARLSLSDDEVRRFARQLGEILDHFQRIQAVDTDGVEPLAHPLPLVNVLRADEPGECLDAERALANAPQRIETFFKVPKILGESSA